MIRLQHRRKHSVSHFQVALFDATRPGAYPSRLETDAMTTFGPRGVVVSTAWDDNGLALPLVDVLVACGDAAAVDDDLVAVGRGEISLGSGGARVGNVLTGDTEDMALPAGPYRVTVYADKSKLFAARRVAFALEALAGVPPAPVSPVEPVEPAR